MTFGITHILFPTDFSKASYAVADHAAGMAKLLGAKISILNVVPWISAWHGASEPYFSVSDDVLRQLEGNQHEAEVLNLKMLSSIRDKLFRGVDCDVLVKSGGVAECIVDTARESGVDFIMLPTRSFGHSRPFLIGSVTAKVLYDARCPVWTSPHPRELDSFRAYRRVICAIDFRTVSEQLVWRASQFAQRFGAQLSLVSAIPVYKLGSGSCVELRTLREQTTASIQEIRRKLDIKASVSVLQGTVGETIREAVLIDDADLVVIGRGHLDEPLGHLRTHAYEIIWDSPCPVLSI